MRNYELKNEYFNWICGLICDNAHPKTEYLRLLKFLHKQEFTYINPLDANRSGDGISLRYEFGYKRKHPQTVIAMFLDIRPCSVLEMMVALALRIEVHIMTDSDKGDRTGVWFWDMISSLGLENMTESNFNLEYAERVVFDFLNRQYDSDGKGGLFTVKNRRQDMRNVEIWYQMCQYLSEYQ